MAITNIQIKNAKPKGKKYTLSAGKSLFLLVMPTGSKLWKYRYRIDNKAGEYSLGAYPIISLSDALKQADALRELVSQGIHPIEDARRKAQAKKLQNKNTVKAIALDWIEAKSNDWKPSHKEGVERSLIKHVYPFIGDMPISDITTDDIFTLLKRIESRNSLVLLRKINQRITRILSYASIKGLIKNMPCTDFKDVLKKPITINHGHLPIDELPELLRKIDDYDKISGVYVVTRLAMQLLSMIFVRTGELRRLKWSHIDAEKKTIEIPSELMKMGNPHIVPLSTQALEIIEQLKPYTSDSEYLFCQQNNKRKPMSENAVLYALYSLGYHGRMTGHGFRHVASTQLNEMGFKSDLIEKQLAHGDSNKIRAVYNKAEYLPERSQMMQSWSDYLDGIKKGAKIVTLYKKK